MRDETIWVLGTTLKILSFILQALRKDGIFWIEIEV